MKKLLCLLCLTTISCIAKAHPREMMLAGGAMKLCSSLSMSSCQSGDSAFSNARKTARFQMTPNSISLALNPEFWSTRNGAPSSFEMSQMLKASAKKNKDRIVSADELADIFSEVCTASGTMAKCKNPIAISTWEKLLDDERSYVLSAFELPERNGGQRRREVANIADSKNRHGVDILQAFVKAAAQRSPSKRPVILFVTAAGTDPYDAVDFYISAFKQAGADPVWWPIDSALEASISDPAGCNTLTNYRVKQLGLANREAVYPDLTEIQKVACENAASLAQFPSQAQGIFFGGGDQWRMRQVFFDENDQPNIWLKSLRATFNTGSIVIGGTSAGTTIQSSQAMLTGGTSSAALMRGTKISLPVASGCERAHRCPDSLIEDELTYWPAGGLALVEGFVMDTHFSERARPLRLLKLLADTRPGVGIGVDETSALHLIWKDKQVEVEALGASGAWWFESPHLQGTTISTRVHYLAPGRKFTWNNKVLSHKGNSTSPPLSTKLLSKFTNTDALNDKTLRDAAQRFAQYDISMITLRASDYVVKLNKTEGARTWRGADGQTGISGLLMEISADKQ